MASHQTQYDAVLYSFSKPFHSAKPLGYRTFTGDGPHMALGSKWLYQPPLYSHREWFDAHVEMYTHVRRYMNPSKPLILDLAGHGVPAWRYVKSLVTKEFRHLDLSEVWDTFRRVISLADFVIGSDREPEQRRDDYGYYSVPTDILKMIDERSPSLIDPHIDPDHGVSKS